MEPEKELKLGHQQESKAEEHRKALRWLFRAMGSGSGSGIR